MNTRITWLGFLLMLMCFNFVFAQNTISWDFEGGNDHGFDLRCINPATPAEDDPYIAGDESITGVGGDNGLPGAGVAWTIGPPNMFDGFEPAVNEGCHVVDYVLEYSDCNDPFGAAEGDPPYDFANSRGQSGYLNTYNLSQWGDDLHTEENDQIATSPKIVLGEEAELTVWAVGGSMESWAGSKMAPEFDPDPAQGYATGSGGIAVVSAVDGLLLASVMIAAEGVDSTHADSSKMPDRFWLDLWDYAGEEVVVEVVDAFQGGWGWYAIDEIQVRNATLIDTDVSSEPNAAPTTFGLMQNYPNPFNPNTNIQFQIPKDGHVTLSVFNTLGQPVATLMDQFMKSGTHQVTFDATHFPSGIYCCRLQAENFTQMKKMMLLK